MGLRVALRIVSAEKRRGDLPCGISPLLFRFFRRPGSGTRSQRLSLRSGLVDANLSARAAHTLPSFHLVVRAFSVPSKASGCPVTSRDPFPVLLIAPCQLSPSGSPDVQRWFKNFLAHEAGIFERRLSVSASNLRAFGAFSVTACDNAAPPKARGYCDLDARPIRQA